MSALPPLVVEIEVGVPPTEAFAIWTERASLWWPPSHTLSGQPQHIVYEARAGGRVYEVQPDGGEMNWGEIIVWQPPDRLVVLWHLFFDRSEATQLEITFTPTESGTLVRLVQTGWDALGEQGTPRRDRTLTVWSSLLALFAEEGDGATRR